jgi:galactokinase
MDQTIAALAEPATALLFDTLSGERQPVPLPGNLWILETGVSHRLTGGGLNARRRECEAAVEILQSRWPGLRYLAKIAPAELPEALELLNDAVLVRRVRHVVSETERTRAAASALQSGDLARLGTLLVEGHESLRQDYESTIPEADLLVTSALGHGAYGARLTGAGWGGAVVMLASPDRGELVVQEVSRDFARSFERTPVVWSSRATGGVQARRMGN